MRVLFATSTTEHGHDYLYDYLFVGFRTLERKGAIERVDASYRSPWLFLPEDPTRPGSAIPAPGTRDACNLDTDQACAWREPDAPSYDLVVGGAHCLKDMSREVGRAPKAAVIDGTDHLFSLRPKVDQALGGHAVRVAGYFKREVPTGSGWGIPLPLCYPAERIPHVPLPRRVRAAYFATTHGGNATSRVRIAEGLREVPWSLVHTGPTQEHRPSPEEVHDALWTSLVGVHWNPFVMREGQGWDGNRFWENCAFGLVTVSQRPWNEIPDPFVDGENVVWVDAPEEVVPAVRRLLDDPGHARRMAAAAHSHFLRHHTAEARARYVLRHCGFEAPRG